MFTFYLQLIRFWERTCINGTGITYIIRKTYSKVVKDVVDRIHLYTPHTISIFKNPHILWVAQVNLLLYTLFYTFPTFTYILWLFYDHSTLDNLCDFILVGNGQNTGYFKMKDSYVCYTLYVTIVVNHVWIYLLNL